MKKANTKQIKQIDILNTYIANARAAVDVERQAARKNTLDLIASLASVLIYVYKTSGESITKKDSTDISPKAGRAYIMSTVYNKVDFTRSDYMKVTAALYVANKIKGLSTIDNIQTEANKFVDCYNSVNDLFIESGAKKSSGGAGKRKEEQKTKTTAASAESDSVTESVSTKTTYQRVAEGFTNLNKLLSKVEKADLTPEFIKLVESNLGELDKVVKVVVAKSKLSYKTAKKAA